MWIEDMATGIRPKSAWRNTGYLYNQMKYRLQRTTLSPVRFVIFGRGRSGSTTLVSLLNELPSVACDGEILSQPVLNPLSHVLAKCANSKSAVYGCKILSYQVQSVQPIPERASFLSELADAGFKVIYLKRENLVFHALSNMRARQFGFHRLSVDQENQQKLTVDMDDLMYWLHGSEQLNHYETRLLDGISYLPLTYEKNLATEESQKSTTVGLCQFLGQEYRDVSSKYRKISPEKLCDSVENYDELVEFLKNTPYGKFVGA
jgi:LPS sulfotransferase NodH